MSLGTRKVTFDKVDTGVEVTVQLAIVTDTANGHYLISDIMAQDLHQSLTAPRFTTDIQQAVEAGITGKTETIPGSTFHYVGYNEKFGNYRRAPGGEHSSPTRVPQGCTSAWRTLPQNPRPSGTLWMSTPTFCASPTGAAMWCPRATMWPPGCPTTVFTDWWGGVHRGHPRQHDKVQQRQEQRRRRVRTSIQDGSPIPTVAGGTWTLGLPGLAPANRGLFLGGLTNLAPVNQVFVEPPDAHRDFPIDVLASDETYRFTAWAVNDKGDVISPVAALTVHPVDELITIAGVFFADYITAYEGVTALYVTRFTVLK